jgi:hypothetical protein
VKLRAFAGNFADPVAADNSMNLDGRPELSGANVSAVNGAAVTNGTSVPPPGDTNAAAFVAALSKPKKPNPLPISSLRSGFCYDIRMRFHQTVDYRENHPEDPRRIYRIYKEFALAGLIEDRESQSSDPEELLMRIRSRYATEDEILLVHSKEHLQEIKSTQSTVSSFLN